MRKSLRQFEIFINPYYWRTAVLIAQNTLAKQYRNSFLGILWTLFQPLSLIVVYSIIMPMIMRFPAKDYVLYIICTIPLWTFISSALINAPNTLLSQAETLKRCIISSTVFPVADVLRHAYTYAIAFVVMYGFAILSGLEGSWHVFLLPLYFIPILITVMALCVGLAFIAPYIRDIADAVFIALNMSVWFNAVYYPISVVPAWVQHLLHYNPFYILLEPIITLAYTHDLPTAMMMGKQFIIMLCAILFGYTLYRSFRRNFVYYL